MALSDFFLKTQQMHSDEYESESYSDSSIEEVDEHSTDMQSLYEDIADSLSEIIELNPLTDDLPLSDAIKSRITALTELYHATLKQYDNDIECEQFWFKLDDLTDAIYGIAQLLDNMENDYEDLEHSLDTGARYHVRLFPIPLDDYLNDTRRKIIKDFNNFISDDNWLLFTADESEKQLPLLDKLKIPENLIKKQRH